MFFEQAGSYLSQNVYRAPIKMHFLDYWRFTSFAFRYDFARAKSDVISLFTGTCLGCFATVALAKIHRFVRQSLRAHHKSSEFLIMTKLSEKLLKLGNRAIKKAQENNRKNGFPNVYCINGKIVFELPNGEITTKYSFS